MWVRVSEGEWVYELVITLMQDKTMREMFMTFFVDLMNKQYSLREGK